MPSSRISCILSINDFYMLLCLQWVEHLDPDLSGRKRKYSATITAGDVIGEFVFSIPTTLNCEDLEVLAPNRKMLSSGDTKRIPFNH